MKEKFLNSCINFITKYNNYTDKDIKKLRYGLEGIYLTLTKTIIILLLSLVLKIFFEVIIVIVLFNIIRYFGFGFHADKSWQCLLMSIFNFIIIPYILLSININFYLNILISVVCIVSFILWAPADTVKRPLKDKKKRLIRKIVTTTIGILFSIFSIFLINYRAIILSALIIQFIVVCPLTYIIMNQSFNNYKNC
jgi:accessory gene regulator B